HHSHSGADHVAPTVRELDIDYSPLVMDRIGVFNFFEAIFGPQARNLSAVRSLVRDPNVFGGGCSFYRQSTSNPTDISTYCGNNTASLAVKPLMGITVLRQGRINQACHELTQNSTTIKYVLSRIDPVNAVPAATKDNLQSLFSLFYRARPVPDDSLFDAMAVNMIEENLNGWKRVVYGVCVSGYWQVL